MCSAWKSLGVGALILFACVGGFVVLLRLGGAIDYVARADAALWRTQERLEELQLKHYKLREEVMNLHSDMQRLRERVRK